MSKAASRPSRAPTFSLRIGRWFEASATGLGVLALPLLLLLLIGAAALGVRL